MKTLAFALLSVLLTSCVAPAPASPAERPVNTHCPRSGKPVAADSLTTYRGAIVGFCNPHCRDDFAAHPEQCPEYRAFFDEILAARR